MKRYFLGIAISYELLPGIIATGRLPESYGLPPYIGEIPPDAVVVDIQPCPERRSLLVTLEHPSFREWHHGDHMGYSDIRFLFPDEREAKCSATSGSKTG